MPIVQKASISKPILNPKYNYMFPNELGYTPETPVPPFKVKYSRKKFKGNPIIDIQTQTENVNLGNVLGAQPRSLYPALSAPTIPFNPIVQTPEVPTLPTPVQPEVTIPLPPFNPIVQTPEVPTLPTPVQPEVPITIPSPVQVPTLSSVQTPEAPATVLEATPTSEPVDIPDSSRYVTMTAQYAFRLFADFGRNVVDIFLEANHELAEALETSAEVAAQALVTSAELAARAIVSSAELLQSMRPYARLSYAQSIQLMRHGFVGIQNLIVHAQSLSGPLRNVGIALNEFIQTQSENSRQIVEAFIRRYVAQPIVASMNDELRTRIINILRELNQNRGQASAIILREVRNILESIVEVDQPSVPLIGSSESTGLVVQRPSGRNTNLDQAMNQIVEGMQRLSLDADQLRDGGERILIDAVTLWFISIIGTITTYGLQRIGK